MHIEYPWIYVLLAGVLLAGRAGSVKPRVNWTPIWMSSSRFRILDFEFFPTHLCRGFVAMALQDPLFII